MHESIAIAHHCVGFTGTRLPVHEDAAVVALEGVGNDLFTDCVEDVVLVGLGREDAVESKRVFVQFYLGGSVENGFLLAARLDSDEDLNGVPVRMLLVIHLTVKFDFISINQKASLISAPASHLPQQVTSLLISSQLPRSKLVSG